MSKLLNVAHKVLAEPWLIEPQAHAVLCRILEAHIAGGEIEQSFRANGEKLLDMKQANETEDAAPYSVVDGVAIVALDGVIGRKVGPLERSSGVTDVDEFSAAMEAAANDQEVSAIVLSVDSPGGTIGGVQRAADTVRTVQGMKPVIAHASDVMASAAYWIASGAGQIYADQTATVGSIGVYSAILDRSREMELAGLKQVVFASGKFKAAGMLGTSLTEGQSQAIQKRVDSLASIFKTDVRRTRPAVSDDSMQGQTMLGDEAKAAGLIDAVATFEQAITDARNWANL